MKKNDVGSGVREIEFYHPQHNSLPGTLLRDLARYISEAGTDGSVEMIILKSGGDRTFCAGASFDELVNIDDFEAGKQFFMGFANVINACRKCPKLIIGRVQGKAVGGGVGLASAVDYCFASKYAAVKLSELNIGIGPFVVGPAIERKIGLGALSSLAINANEFQSAEWAQSKGLYSEIFKTIEEMDEAVGKFARNLSNTNPEARSTLKKVFWEGCEDWDHFLESRAELSGRMVLSTYTKETLAKYAKK